jgi:hypothetical protein
LWVLLGATGSEVRLYREGVLRTCSAPYRLDDLGWADASPADASPAAAQGAPTSTFDVFAHLSNHCIQTQAEAYGAHEPTNELFYDEFARVLGPGVLEGKLLPQASAPPWLSGDGAGDGLGEFCPHLAQGPQSLLVEAF